MSILYLNSSALVKQYIRESGSSEVQNLILTSEHAGTSLVTRAEMAAALARAARH